MKARLNAGSLDRVGTVEAPPAVKNGFGEKSGAWRKVPGLDRVACMVEPLGESEKQTDSGKVAAIGSVRITLRYTTMISPVMRITIDGAKYEITGVQEGEGRRQWTVLSARRIY